MSSGATDLVQQLSGWLGLLLGATAFYGGTALLLEDGRHHTVLPLFRRAQAQRALEGDLSAQIAEIEKEAGVRQQL
jgi:hypothetical protein